MNIQSLVKTLFVLIIFCLLLALPGQALAGSESGFSFAATNRLTPLFATGTAVVNSGALNVRSGPGVAYGRIATVYKDQTVNLLGRNADGSWVKIGLYNGVEGWVNATLITPSIAISALDVLITTSTAHVASGNLNVRSGPDVTYNSVAIAGNGDALLLLGRNGAATWVKVRLASGTEGWVNASLITTGISIASLPVLDTGSASSEPTATVATEALNIRSGPDSSYNVIATLTYGQPMVLLGRTASSGWAQVRIYNGGIGWAYGAYLNASVAFSTLPVVTIVSAPNPGPGPGPNTGGPGPAPMAATGTVVASALNVRSGPGLGYWVVTGVYWGQQVTIHGRSADGGWLKISVGGYSGWVSSYYIQTSAPFYTLPIAYA